MGLSVPGGTANTVHESSHPPGTLNIDTDFVRQNPLSRVLDTPGELESRTSQPYPATTATPASPATPSSPVIPVSPTSPATPSSPASPATPAIPDQVWVRHPRPLSTPVPTTSPATSRRNKFSTLVDAVCCPNIHVIHHTGACTVGSGTLCSQGPLGVRDSRRPKARSVSWSIRVKPS